jgi:hypothetical protein
MASAALEGQDNQPLMIGLSSLMVYENGRGRVEASSQFYWRKRHAPES